MSSTRRRRGGPRRRDRDAHATLRRVDVQRSRLATDTATARGPRDELAAVTAVLRSAAAPGAHQIEQARADRLVAGVVEQARAALSELHTRQQRRAEHTLASSPERRSS